MYCSKCGTQIPDDAKFCSHCGNPVKETAKQPLKPSQEASPEKLPPSSGQETGKFQPASPNTERMAPDDPPNKDEVCGGAGEDEDPGEGIDDTPHVPSDFYEPQDPEAEESDFSITVDLESDDDDSYIDEERTGIPEGSEPAGYEDEEGEIPFDDEIYDDNPTDGGPPPQRRKRNLALLISGGLMLVIAIVCVAFALVNHANNRAYQEALDTGNAFLLEGEYEQAIRSFQEAMDRKPKDAAARLGLSKAYLCDGRFQDAKDLLNQLHLSDSDEDYPLLQQLLTLVCFDRERVQVDTSAFPNITLGLTYSGDFALTEENCTVTEGGTAREIAQVTAENGAARISYQTEDTDVSDESRELSLTLTVEEVQIPLSFSYTTPHFEPAHLTLVSTDVSQYPIIRAYFRVTDENGNTLSGLSAASFTVHERIKGGEFLARAVKSAVPLDGNAGLNIDLVADKSDSISSSDMAKIKTVMVEFVNRLHYDVGDKAEVLAFDSIVQQMCYYTNDASLLVNGIQNMSTDGTTAFYDAVYDGITHAALQGGARCVIAFTDGMDNESRHTPSEVVSYANSKQVPVYIIGVGSQVEASTLRAMAQNTSGRYWFIDDLYDLEHIFDQVYTEQKELYVVEYESDSSLDSYLSRDITVRVSGDGCRTRADVSFTPVRSIKDSGSDHKSRYQLVKESCTWEEASQKCQEMGGHLATITSQSEMDALVKMASSAGAKYVWLGGYTSYDDGGKVFGHWVTGEDFGYQAWADGEPSRVDQDGTPEWYIMLWNIPELGGWTWNDQRNDPAGSLPKMKDGMAFICEFES